MITTALFISANFFYSFIIMWLVWLAIFILAILVLFNSAREGMTSLQAYDIQKVISSKKTIDDKIKDLFGESATVAITDDEITDILKNSSLSNEDKINNIKAIFIKLVDDRNDSPNSIYFKTPNKISSSNLFAINDIINNPDLDKSSDKLFLIKELNILEPTFLNIINNTSITDDVKLFGDPDNIYKGENLSSLINQVLFENFVKPSPPPPPPKKK